MAGKEASKRDQAWDKVGRLRKVRWCWDQLADKLEEELLGTSPSCHCCCAIPPDTIRPTMPLHSLLPTSIPTIPLSSYSAHVRPLGQVKKSIVATSFSRVDLYTFALAGWLSRVEYKNVLNDRREGSYLPDWDFNKFTNCQTLIFELKTRSTIWKYDCVWFIKAKYKQCIAMCLQHMKKYCMLSVIKVWKSCSLVISIHLLNLDWQSEKQEMLITDSFAQKSENSIEFSPPF